jgi:hypothetical protein
MHKSYYSHDAAVCRADMKVAGDQSWAQDQSCLPATVQQPLRFADLKKSTDTVRVTVFCCAVWAYLHRNITFF